MAKVIKKRRKLKIVAVLLFLLILFGIGFVGYVLLDMPIRNILIKGNTLLKDQEIIEQAGIEDYPSFLRTTAHKIKKNLSDNPYIESVKVHKQFFNKLVIEIEENRILYIDSTTNQMMLSSGESIASDEHSIGHAFLINEVAEEYKQEFIERMNEIQPEILQKVSEIKYEPTELDQGRFLFTMSDGNYVYLTLTKFKNINYYEDVLPQLEGKKGILYLDSGNHFEIMED